MAIDLGTVTLRKEAIYTLVVDGKEFPGFFLDDEWRGFICLKDLKDQRVILYPTQEESKLLGLLLGTNGEDQQVIVMKLSPSLAAEMTKKPAESPLLGMMANDSDNK